MNVRIITLCIGFISLLIFTACEETHIAPGTSCNYWNDETCESRQECVDSKCWFKCELSGDCDPGYLCSEGLCLPKCRTLKDCGLREMCVDLEIQNSVGKKQVCKRGRCNSDAQCNDVCARGTCAKQCSSYDWVCLDGEFCGIYKTEGWACLPLDY